MNNNKKKYRANLFSNFFKFKLNTVLHQFVDAWTALDLRK